MNSQTNPAVTKRMVPHDVIKALEKTLCDHLDHKQIAVSLQTVTTHIQNYPGNVNLHLLKAFLMLVIDSHNPAWRQEVTLAQTCMPQSSPILQSLVEFNLHVMESIYLLNAGQYEEFRKLYEIVLSGHTKNSIRQMFTSEIVLMISWLIQENLSVFSPALSALFNEKYLITQDPIDNDMSNGAALLLTNTDIASSLLNHGNKSGDEVKLTSIMGKVSQMERARESYLLSALLPILSLNHVYGFQLPFEPAYNDFISLQRNETARNFLQACCPDLSLDDYQRLVPMLYGWNEPLTEALCQKIVALANDQTKVVNDAEYQQQVMALYQAGFYQQGLQMINAQIHDHPGHYYSYLARVKFLFITDKYRNIGAMLSDIEVVKFMQKFALATLNPEDLTWYRILARDVYITAMDVGRAQHFQDLLLQEQQGNSIKQKELKKTFVAKINDLENVYSDVAPRYIYRRNRFIANILHSPSLLALLEKVERLFTAEDIAKFQQKIDPQNARDYLDDCKGMVCIEHAYFANMDVDKINMFEFKWGYAKSVFNSVTNPAVRAKWNLSAPEAVQLVEEKLPHLALYDFAEADARFSAVSDDDKKGKGYVSLKKKSKDLLNKFRKIIEGIQTTHQFGSKAEMKVMKSLHDDLLTCFANLEAYLKTDLTKPEVIAVAESKNTGNLNVVADKSPQVVNHDDISSIAITPEIVISPSSNAARNMVSPSLSSPSWADMEDDEDEALKAEYQNLSAISTPVSAASTPTARLSPEKDDDGFITVQYRKVKTPSPSSLKASIFKSRSHHQLSNKNEKSQHRSPREKSKLTGVTPIIHIQSPYVNAQQTTPKMNIQKLSVFTPAATNSVPEKIKTQEIAVQTDVDQEAQNLFAETQNIYKEWCHKEYQWNLYSPWMSSLKAEFTGLENIVPSASIKTFDEFKAEWNVNNPAEFKEEVMMNKFDQAGIEPLILQKMDEQSIDKLTSERGQINHSSGLPDFTQAALHMDSKVSARSEIAVQTDSVPDKRQLAKSKHNWSLLLAYKQHQVTACEAWKSSVIKNLDRIGYVKFPYVEPYGEYCKRVAAMHQQVEPVQQATLSK